MHLSTYVYAYAYVHQCLCMYVYGWMDGYVRMDMNVFSMIPMVSLVNSTR